MKELIYYMVLTGFILQIVPEEYRKYVELYTGMILLLVVADQISVWLG